MYSTWNIIQLKDELRRRGAALRGRKAELIERLELYDKNFNFGKFNVGDNEEPSIILPALNSYKDINSSTILPPLSKLHIRDYFGCSVKKLNKAWALYESRFLLTARLSKIGDFTFVKGLCKKTMKQIHYEVDIKIHRNGTPEQSHCECPAGSGTDAKCKHVAVLMYAVDQMFHDKFMLLHQVCTQQLQSFHIPKGVYTASPIAAHKLPVKRERILFKPYPIEKVDKTNYNTRVRNIILNCVSSMPFKQLYSPANPYAIKNDHAYTSFDPETELLKKLKLVDVTIEEIHSIEQATRLQTNCPIWVSERKHRITASRFHTICHLRPTSKETFSSQMIHQKLFSSRATTHGILNEPVALNKYVSEYQLNVQKCGLFISKERPYLGASPDGLLGDEAIIEIKCPYASRNQTICPVTVPYLVYDNNTLTLKKTSPYYYQVQGQLYCTRRNFCNLIVYTYKDMKVLYLTKDEVFIKNMLKDLDDFYSNYFKKAILKEFLYYNYDKYIIKNKCK